MYKSILKEGKKIRYRVTGSGRPVLLLHGFGEEANTWNNAAELLKNTYRLIIPDLPGSDQSEMIPDMSMEGMAEAMKQILDEEISDPAEKTVIIGHSMGGYITLAFVEKYPERVSAFGLFHSTAYPDSEEKKAIRQKGIRFIEEHGPYEFLKTTTPNLFSPLTREKKPGLVDQHISGLHNFSAPVLVSYYVAMMARPDRTRVLREAAVPVLFIMGKYDAAVPVEDGLRQCSLPEKSYIHILRESGHMGMLEETERTNLILQNFLAEM